MSKQFWKFLRWLDNSFMKILRTCRVGGVTKQSNEVTSNKVTRNRVTGKNLEGEIFQNRLKLRKIVWNSKD